MKLLIFLANSLFLILYRIKYNRFFRFGAKIQLTQESILLKNIRANQNTTFGRKFGFCKIRSINDFQRQLPLTTYANYLPFIQEIMDGRKFVLTSDEVTNLVPTSGSSAAVKYIPYTKSFLREYKTGINIWIYNLYKSFPGLISGQQFWIITPHSKLGQTKSKVPIGFATDSSYLSTIVRSLMKHVLVLPDELGGITNNENYFYLISYYLMGYSNIRLISVWNPSMLISITNFIEKNINSLVEDIKSGIIRLPRSDISSDANIISQLPKIKSPQRAEDLLRLKRTENFTINMFWPNLLLISCWTDSWAKNYLPAVHRLFPGIPVQGKGLLATEAAISIPINNVQRRILLYNAHFCEFKSLKSGSIYLASELQAGEQYEVIITTSGGLYRYCMQDIVEVSGFERGLPLLTFIGKSDKISDLTGEKLSEIHVSKIVEDLSNEWFSAQGQTFLGIAKHNETYAYVLFVDKSILKQEINTTKLSEVLDQRLSENFHYMNSRNMNQLARPGIALLSNKAANKYLKLKTSSTLRNTVKFSALETDINMLKKLDIDIIWPLNEEITYYST